METNVIMTEEDRGFVQKARDFNKKSKDKLEQARKDYKEKYIDTGKSQELEQKIENDAKRKKRAIKIAGTVATVLLMFTAADGGPLGEICTALATPGLCKLVDIATDIKKKSLITGKRAVENHFLKVDGSNDKVEGYDLEGKDLPNDIGNLIKEVEGFSRSL